MPVFIYEPDAFDKICQFEGNEYEANQRDWNTSNFTAFKKVWEEDCKDNQWVREQGKDMAISARDGNGAIYGWHGWNRYLVYCSGEIVFLGDMSYKEAINKAKNIGFRIV
jgi:hypothetical protein